QAHQQAYAIGILHRDLSVRNIIIIDGRGYLIDWDFAKSMSVEWLRRLTRTGTWQFLSVHLVKDTSALHRVQDDMELVFWVLLWTVLMYSQSSLSLQARTTFIRSTFESVPGTESKRGVFASQTVHRPTLLPGRGSLHKLLKTLADLFRYFYYQPEKRDEAAVERVKALQDHSIEVQDVLQALPSYQHDESVKKLKNHEHIIDIFSTHLQME
ncbi:hypothetical protein HD554DRAFT_2028707, partial [Boletus coccyginus]